MRFLCLTADVANPQPNLGDYFITSAIEWLLSAHETSRLPIHVRPSSEDLAFARFFDAIIICGTNLVGEGGTVRCGWTLDDFREVGRPVIPLGLGSQADRDKAVAIDPTGQNMLAYWYESSGAISVRDPLTFQFVERLLGPGTAVLTGCPSTAVAEPRPSALRQHLIFCSPAYHYRPDWMNASDWPGSLVRDFFDQVGEHRSALYLAQQPSDFLFDASEPGWNTVYSPLFPANHRELLAAAREIVSFRIHPALVGVTHGSPAVVLCLDARTESLAETYQIPAVRVTPELTAAALWERCKQRLENYPWGAIQERIETHRTSLLHHLEQKGITPSRGGRPLPVRDPGERFPIAAIADKRYFGQLLGLVENLKQVESRPLRLHLLLLDSEGEALARQHLQGVEVLRYRLEDIWSASACAPIRQRPVAEQAYSSKPSLLRRAIADSSAPVLFCDADLFFFESPWHLLAATPENGALLFPHWNHSTPENRWHGLFNSGLLAAAPGSEDFLDWWSRLCVESWGKDRERGTYFEQGFLDLAPLRFETVKAYRGHEHNIGPWNIEESGVFLPPVMPWQPELPGGEKVKSIHSASPDRLGLFEIKTTWDQVNCLVHGLPLSTLGEDVREALVTAQARHWPALKRAIFLYQSVRYRFNVEIPFPSSGLLNEVTRGRLKHPISLLAYCYRQGRDTYRQLRGQPLSGVDLLSMPPQPL